MGEKPQFRLIRKNVQTNKWDNIGGAWTRDNGGFSLSIELVRGGEKIKCLMVENKEKPNGTTKQAEQQTEVIDDSIPFDF